MLRFAGACTKDDAVSALSAATPHALRISLTATPVFRDEGNVGYDTCTDNDIGAIRVEPQDVAGLFQANRTNGLKLSDLGVQIINTRLAGLGFQGFKGRDGFRCGHE